MRYIVLIAISLGCSTPLEFKFQRPLYHPDYYIGDPAHKRVINEDNDTISCGSGEFSNMVCMKKEKFDDLTKELKRGRSGD